MTRPALTILLILTSFCFSQYPDAHRTIMEMERERHSRFSTKLAKTSFDPARHVFDAHFYGLDLEIDPDREYLRGAVTVKGTSLRDSLSEIELDLYDNMQIDSITSAAGLLGFTHAGGKIRVQWPENLANGDQFQLTVYYGGKPESSGFGSFSFTSYNGNPVISTLSEPYGAPSWWPCKDDPSDKADSVDIIVTVPKDLVVASNGVLVDEGYRRDGRKIYHWQERYPITTYLVSLAISNYKRWSEYYHYSADDSMEVQFFAYPSHLSKAKEDFNVIVPMLEFYSDIYGEYPFIKEKYGMAEFPWGGAMEHQTCTSYGHGLVRGNHYYDFIAAHELVHQWFGDYVTMDTWPHIWLNEGFATHGEALWEEHIKGPAAYRRYMNDLDAYGYFTGPVYIANDDNVNALFSRTVYDKGAWVLHMLRFVMGEEAFFEMLKVYPQRFAFSTATTEQLRDVCEELSGMELDWFFEQWIYGANRPFYEYSWYTVKENDSSRVMLSISQIQTNAGLFKMPLEIELSLADGIDTTFVIWDSLAQQDFAFTVADSVKNLSIDPQHRLLRKLRRVDPTGIEDVPGQPLQWVLEPNYPNPFNPQTTIDFQTAGDGIVEIAVFNMLGQKVKTLFSGFRAKGNGRVVWQGDTDKGVRASSGVYFYELRSATTTLRRKMLLLR